MFSLIFLNEQPLLQWFVLGAKKRFYVRAKKSLLMPIGFFKDRPPKNTSKKQDSTLKVCDGKNPRMIKDNGEQMR